MHRAAVGHYPAGQTLDGLLNGPVRQRATAVKQANDHHDAAPVARLAAPGAHADLSRLQFQQQRHRLDQRAIDGELQVDSQQAGVALQPGYASGADVLWAVEAP